MKMKNLPNTDLNLSLLGLGTEQFSGSWGILFSQKEVCDILSIAEDHNINHLDTAECYGDHLSEKLIGKAVTNRVHWVISSKFGHEYVDKKKKNAFDYKSVQKQLNASLKALKTDYIDIYYFHSGDDEHFFNDDLWGFLNKQVENGKIRYLGLSFKHGLVARNQYQQVEKAKEYNIKIVQTVYNYISQESSEFLIPLSRKHGMAIIGRMPLAKGLLTGKYSSNNDFNNKDPRSNFADFNEKAFITILNELSDIPKKELSNWAISWVLSIGTVDVTIVGCKNKKQLLENIASLEYEI